VVGPARIKDRILYAQLRSSESLVLGGYLRPANSIKEFFFPKQETLYRYRIQGRNIELIDPSGGIHEQLIIAARPCDAAALPILDDVFNWDFADEFYNRRRAATTIITVACSAADDACFCTSVGIGPEDPRGSDAILLEVGEGRYHVRPVTEKGGKLFAGRTESSKESAMATKGPGRKFEAEKIRTFVNGHFEDPIWAEHGRSCMACGVCAFSCPTCHCFDIIDAGPAAGRARVRTWDTCQFPNFTQHASGHNPRAMQPARQRQRILHKFAIYPEKFGKILCTGCGNCVRNCPVGLGVLDMLTEIEHGQHL
jgi:ferredoxin